MVASVVDTQTIGPSAAERLALRVMQLGAIAVVLVVSTFNAFELDRFFLPKELALHLTAVAAALLAFRSISRLSVTRVDLLLIGYLLLSTLSAAMATNRWLAMRAWAISASGALIFWTSQALRDAGVAPPLLGALTLAVVLAAVTSLLQTYGVDIVLFSESRVPGGTLGNRNFIAHIAAFGLPLCMLAAFRARSFFRSISVAIVTASLVLTRSRAAWLAFAAVMLVFFVAMLVSSALRRDGRTWRRLAAILILAGCGVAAALLIPNTLRWRSRNPYLESMQRVADYQEGSGRGRLVQYQQSLWMAVRHPLFGVGPGNWAVEYPAHAARRDPSLNESEPGMTFNPWPSSDWVALVAERGFPGAVLLVLVVVFIAIGGVRQLISAVDAEEALVATALLGTVVGVIVAGLFDAVLLAAVPSFLVWAAVGALRSPSPRGGQRVVGVALIAVIVIAAIGAARSAMQIAAMQIYATRGDRASLERAARIDPGSYRLQLRLARVGGRKERCQHARAAHDLFPSAIAATEASRGCGE